MGQGVTLRINVSDRTIDSQLLNPRRPSHESCLSGSNNRIAQRSLCLYVSGEAPSSRRARDNFARLCADHLPPGYDVKVIDVMTEPHLAEAARILATPTLIYGDPAVPKRIIGDLGDSQRVLEFLGIQQSSAHD